MKKLIILIFIVIMLSGCLDLNSLIQHDSDGDGYADDVDVFPYDRDEHIDSDNDGVGDNKDAFPDNPLYWSDYNHNGIADNLEDMPIEEVEGYDELDTDKDGYKNSVDAFPTDARYHSDKDGDGVADEIDVMPTNSMYSKICPVCDGTGESISYSEVQFNYNVHTEMENKGYLNPDYYYYVTIENKQNRRGLFEVYAMAIIGRDTVWDEWDTHYLNPNQEYTFEFHYDPDEEVDLFSSNLNIPTYTETFYDTCQECQGTGYV